MLESCGCLCLYMVLVVRGMKQEGKDCLHSVGGNVSIVLLGNLDIRVGNEVVEDVVGRHWACGRPGRN